MGENNCDKCGEWTQTLSRIESKIDSHISEVRRGFVADEYGDPDYRGHREYHSRLIDRAARDEATRQRIMDKILSGSAWAVLLLVATALWQYFLTKIGK